MDFSVHELTHCEFSYSLVNRSHKKMAVPVYELQIYANVGHVFGEIKGRLMFLGSTQLGTAS